jgi:hypothetical protein
MRCVSFAATRVSIVGWIYDPDHSLPPGMYVDVPHLDCLLVAVQSYRELYGLITDHMRLNYLFIQLYMPDVFTSPAAMEASYKAALASLHHMTPSDFFSLVIENRKKMFTQNFDKEKLADICDAFELWRPDRGYSHNPRHRPNYGERIAPGGRGAPAPRPLCVRSRRRQAAETDSRATREKPLEARAAGEAGEVGRNPARATCAGKRACVMNITKVDGKWHVVEGEPSRE